LNVLQTLFAGIKEDFFYFFDFVFWFCYGDGTVEFRVFKRDANGVFFDCTVFFAVDAF
jgi:hypothetical protein